MRSFSPTTHDKSTLSGYERETTEIDKTREMDQTSSSRDVAREDWSQSFSAEGGRSGRPASSLAGHRVRYIKLVIILVRACLWQRGGVLTEV
jgi:hypothetical protein